MMRLLISPSNRFFCLSFRSSGRQTSGFGSRARSLATPATNHAFLSHMQLTSDDLFVPNPALPSLGAVVLCGGQSSRLGINKQELIFNGKTFLETIVAALAPVTQRIVLVGNVDPNKHQLPDSVVVLEDELVGKGPIEGIRVGLRSLAEDCQYAFVSSCDVPLLTGDVVRISVRSTGLPGRDCSDQRRSPIRHDRDLSHQSAYGDRQANRAKPVACL